MNLIFFDDVNRDYLLPFTLSRPVADIRIGILTIREKWENIFQRKSSTHTQDYLQAKYPLQIGDDNLLIAGSALPSAPLVDDILALKLGEALYENDNLIAIRLNKNEITSFPKIEALKKNITYPIARLSRNWHIFQNNDTEIRKDFQLLTAHRDSASLSSTNRLIGDAQHLFIEEGATIEGAILNTQTGPIYIGQGAEIMEGSLVRGPFALGKGATLKMGSKIYGATTIGPFSKVGGEVNNVIFFGYSNKAHDGFIGNSVVGEWCNFGADSNTSNLKNNYAHIRVPHFATSELIDTQSQFCGLFMGDYSKCGINSMFNSGTIVGVACNLFGTGYIQGRIPSFSYGSPQDGLQINLLNKVIETAKRVFDRRGLNFDKKEEEILKTIFRQSHPTFPLEN